MSASRRDTTVVILLVVGLLAALAGVIVDLGPPRGDGVLLVATDANGAFTFARLSSGNGAVLREQGTTRLVRLHDGAPLRHWAQHARVDRDEKRGIDLAVGKDLVRVNDAGHGELRIAGDALHARVRLDGMAATCPPRLGAVTGQIAAGTEGTLVRGPGIVQRTRAHRRRATDALWVLGTHRAFGVDPGSDCAAWAVDGDDGAMFPAVTPPRKRGDQVEVGPWSVTVETLGTSAPLDPLAHLSAGERMLGRWLSAPPARLHRGRVRVSGPGGVEELLPALLLVHDGAAR